MCFMHAGITTQPRGVSLGGGNLRSVEDGLCMNKTLTLLAYRVAFPS